MFAESWAVAMRETEDEIDAMNAHLRDILDRLRKRKKRVPVVKRQHEHVTHTTGHVVYLPGWGG